MKHRLSLAFAIAVFSLWPASLVAADATPISRIAFGSCASQEKPQPIWDAVLAIKPELFLFLGDNIYADTDNVEVLKSKYKQFGEVAGYQKLLKACPIMAMWDDHDYGLNDGGGDFTGKVASQKVFLEFFNEPADSPRWKRPGVYTAQVFGPPEKRVQVILLDTRYFRSTLKKAGKNYLPNTEPGATLLGDEQWKWFEEQLKQPATVRLIGSSIQLVAEEHPFEKWMNFPAERERFLKVLRDTHAEGVILLSGDRHLAELSEMDAEIGYPLFDLTSSGLNMGNKRWRQTEANRHRVGTMPYGDNFGVVTIDWSKPDPVIALQIRDVDGDITIQQKINLSLLKPSKVPSEAAGAKPKVSPAPVGEGAINTIEAAKKVNEKVTIEMKVMATGGSRDKKLAFLNSAASFRDQDNFTVVLVLNSTTEKLKAQGINDPANYYKNKTVRVTGTVTVFRDHPQITVDDVDQIRVVEK